MSSEIDIVSVCVACKRSGKINNISLCTRKRNELENKQKSYMNDIFILTLWFPT